MALVGKQKAAMLLVNMDSETAAELLKGLDGETVQDLAVELALLDASSKRNRREELKLTQEFCDSLRSGANQGFSIKGFLNEMLVGIVGKDKLKQIQGQIKKATDRGDMFGTVRAASADELFMALQDEHPQTIAVVLSELDPSKSQEILGLLDEEICQKAVCKMSDPEPPTIRVKQRIASMITERLKGFQGETISTKSDDSLRKLAVVLSGLERDLRNRLLDEIGGQNEEVAKKVRDLMVTWEDIISIADRSLQEALRSIEASTMALALSGADEEVAEKVRSNIS